LDQLLRTDPSVSLRVQAAELLWIAEHSQSQTLRQHFADAALECLETALEIDARRQDAAAATNLADAPVAGHAGQKPDR
jgi:hypothetical protein